MRKPFYTINVWHNVRQVGYCSGGPGVTIGLRIQKKMYAIEYCNPCNNGEAVDDSLKP